MATTKAESQLNTLLKSLVSLQKSLPSAVPERWVSQRRNAAAILRRISVLSLFAQELLLHQTPSIALLSSGTLPGSPSSPFTSSSSSSLSSSSLSPSVFLSPTTSSPATSIPASLQSSSMPSSVHATSSSSVSSPASSTLPSATSTPTTSSLPPKTLLQRPTSLLWCVQLCFRELKSTVEKVKLLFKRFEERSCIWQVLEHESLSHELHNINHDMANALNILPLHILDASNDIKEQVQLIYSHLRRSWEPSIDPIITALRDRILALTQEDMDRIEVGELHYVFTSLHLCTYDICEQEVELLTDEMQRQAGTGGIPAVCTIKNLTRLVKHAQYMLFGMPNLHSEMDCPRVSCSIYPEDFIATSFGAFSAAEGPVVPDEFRCPISLDLMRDPVVIATGHTYDRPSICKWIDNGHRTCPKSGQRLLHVIFIPNYALRRMIQRWCEDHSIPYDREDVGSSSHEEDAEEDHISSREEALATMKETVAYLVGKLATGSVEVQRQVAFELRLLTKCGIENRICIAEAGAIPFLVPLLTSPDERTQENAVTAMLNLSICENNKSLIMAAGALDAMVEVLRAGATMTVRENAAAALFSLSMVNDYKLAIGEKPGAIAALVSLLREGSSRGKKDAAIALFHLCIFVGNKPKVVKAGAIPVLLHLLSDERACITDDVLAVLAVLAESKGACAVMLEEKAMPVMVELMRMGSAKGKENAVAVLLALCKHGGEHVAGSLARMEMVLPFVRAIAEMGSSARAKRKAASLLKLLHRQLASH